MSRALLSIRGYARSRAARKLSGRTQAAVQKAIKQGRITQRPDGKIDRDQADQEWEKNSVGESNHDPKKNGKPDSPGTLTEARTAKEWALAELRRLELAEKEGRLADVEVIGRVLDDVFARFNGALDGLPGPWATRLWGCGSREEMQDVLRDLVGEMKEQLRAEADAVELPRAPGSERKQTKPKAKKKGRKKSTAARKPTKKKAKPKSRAKKSTKATKATKKGASKK